MAQVIAQLNHLRISPRKVRAVAELVKGMNIDKAKFQLTHSVRKSSRPLSKLVDSAIANATNNFSMIENNLYIKSIIVNEGVGLKRFRPKSRGRVAPIMKRTSRIKLVLEEKIAGLKMSEKDKKKMKVEKQKGKNIPSTVEKKVSTREASRGSADSDRESLTKSGPSSSHQQVAGKVGNVKAKREVVKLQEKKKQSFEKPSRVKKVAKKGLLSGLKNRLFRRKSI